MRTSTLSVKVSEAFLRQFREFCETHFLQVGKFTEYALAEMMEDYHFGVKAHKVLAEHSGPLLAHKKVIKD